VYASHSLAPSRRATSSRQKRSNVASTAWSVQAIWAAGENPEDWRTGSGLATEEPLAYVESLQEPDGHIRWKRSQDVNGIWMTAYCSVALGGQVWPIPEAPRSNHPIQPPKPGQGEDTQSGNGVIAAGGGRGAPLFSRPKPQSRGRTPGGARVVESKGIKARNHSRTRRGTNTAQSTQTQTAEATSAAESAKASGATRSGPGQDAGSGAGSGGSPPRALVASSGGSARGGSGQEVTGVLIGSADPGQGNLHFGAPGLHGAGIDGGNEEAVAIAIVSAALLLALGGVGWERRRQEAIL